MDYLKDYSTLDAIIEKYRSLPTPSNWSIASMTPGGDFSNYYKWKNPGTDTSKDSARFGRGAWNAPTEAYISLEQLNSGKYNPYFQAEQQSDDTYKAKYTRTNRNLWQLPLSTILNYSIGVNPKNIDQQMLFPVSTRLGLHPQYADLYLDMADELSRIDPNVYEYDLSTLPGYKEKKRMTPPTGKEDLEALIKINPPGTTPKKI